MKVKSLLNVLMLLFGILGTIASIFAWFQIGPKEFLPYAVRALPYAILIVIASLSGLIINLAYDKQKSQKKIKDLEIRLLDPASEDFQLLHEKVFSSGFELDLLDKAKNQFYAIGITHSRLSSPDVQVKIAQKAKNGCDVKLIFQDFDSPSDTLENVVENSRTYHEIYANLSIASFRIAIREGFKRFSELEGKVGSGIDIFRLTSCFPVLPMIIVDKKVYTAPRFVARLLYKPKEKFALNGILAEGVIIDYDTWLGKIFDQHFLFLWNHTKLSRAFSPKKANYEC